MSHTTSFQGRPVRQTKRHGHEARYIADQVIVKLKSEFKDDLRARESVLKALPENSSLHRGFDTMGMAIINLPQSFDSMEIAKELGEQEAVEFAEPNFLEQSS